MFHVAKFMFCFHHHLMLPSSCLLGWGGGVWEWVGLIFYSAIRNYPYSNLPKCPLHSSLAQAVFTVYCVSVINLRQCISWQLFRWPCFIVLLRYFFSLLKAENVRSEVIYVICICQIHLWKSGLFPPAPNFYLEVLRKSLTPPPPPHYTA